LNLTYIYNRTFYEVDGGGLNNSTDYRFPGNFVDCGLDQLIVDQNYDYSGHTRVPNDLTTRGAILK